MLGPRGVAMMSHRTGIRVVVLLFAAGLLGVPGVPPEPSVAGAAAADDIVDPQPFAWTYVDSPEPHYVGVLEYGEAMFTLNNGDTLTTRAYRQQGGSYSIPAPTLHMTPGNKYVVRFRNLLPYEEPSSETNVFKDPNVTNLHTHGVHISGEGVGDDVTRMFEGGFGGDYVYDIPADHMGGTYWYHAHHHGSTYLQVATGGFGLIVIDDSADQIPANVAAMEERQVQIVYLDTAAAGTGGDALISGTLAPGWTVNGKVNGTMTVPPDTWLHWRVLLADVDARLKNLSIGANCETKLLARDGVWRTTAPKDLPTNEISLTGASRADLAVRCTGDSSIAVDSSTVATIVVAGSANPGPHPYAADGVSTWSAERPSYLRDLSNETGVNTEAISMGARTLNSEKFDPNTPTFTLNADAVQEWSLSGATNHPFHLHVYHMQAFGCGGDFEDGEYYDTIASNCDVRFDLNAATGSPYAGMTIMHCHILGHEDRGAMGWVDVIGGTPGPTYPAGQGYSAYYPLLRVRPFGAIVEEGDVGTVTADAIVFLEDENGNPTTAPTDVTVDYATIDSHPNPSVAQAGSDFVSTSGTLTIPAGASQAVVPIEVLGDTIDEPPLLYGEWVLLTFSNVSPPAQLDLSFFGLGLVIILDDD